MKKDIKFILALLFACIFLISAAIGILFPDNEENITTNNNLNLADNNSFNDNVVDNNNVLSNNTVNKNLINNNTFTNNINTTNTINTTNNTNVISNNDTAMHTNKYSNEQLENMALNFYENKNAYRPGFAKATERTDGMIAIQLYDVLENHISSLDWYTIDPNTGKGENIMGEEIDLTSIQ